MIDQVKEYNISLANKAMKFDLSLFHIRKKIITKFCLGVPKKHVVPRVGHEN
jgi:hypothetical protein